MTFKFETTTFDDTCTWPYTAPRIFSYASKDCSNLFSQPTIATTIGYLFLSRDLDL